MRHHFIVITAHGYSYRESFDATPEDAHRLHVEAWERRRVNNPIVMRRADGKRFSVSASKNQIKIGEHHG